MFFDLPEELRNTILRHETLSLAYSRTPFCLNDMDELMKLLIAVGKIGRDNIDSLEFTWQSEADIKCKWVEDPDSDPSLTLPTLHVARCIQLLKQCKKLTF